MCILFNTTSRLPDSANTHKQSNHSYKGNDYCCLPVSKPQTTASRIAWNRSKCERNFIHCFSGNQALRSQQVSYSTHKTPSHDTQRPLPSKLINWFDNVGGYGFSKRNRCHVVGGILRSGETCHNCLEQTLCVL